jgi:D-aspartate ligase
MSTPAIVLGGSGVCGLGVLRSLASAGVDVILLDTNRYEPAMLSRFGRKRIVPTLEGPILIQELLALAPDFPEPALLFPTSDESVATLSRFRQELSDRYILKLPDRCCVEALMDKAGFQQLAERYGFPTPRAVVVRSHDDLIHFNEISLPCIIKPAVKTREYVQQKFQRAYRVWTASDAENICREILPVVGCVVIQDWIEGADSDLYFCLQYRAEDGSTVCSFTGRKVSVWPRDVGTTASCVAAPEAHAELLSLTEAFFSAVSFKGMGGMEYKKDARSGRFLMIEPTVGRVDAQEEIATLNGVNIPLIVYNHETGSRFLHTSRRRRPAVWRNSLAHWRWRRTGASKLDHTLITAVQRQSIHDAYWRIYDPLPGVGHVVNAVLKMGSETPKKNNTVQRRAIDATLATEHQKHEAARRLSM